MVDPWERMTQVWRNIRMGIGETLLPVLNPLINRVADASAMFARWMKMFPNIARWLGYITLGILSFGLAGAAANIIMGVFGFTMLGLKGIAVLLGGAWKALTWTLNLLRPSLLATRIGLAGLWIQSKLLAVWTGVCRVALFAWNAVLKAGAIAMRIYGAATMFAGVAMQILTSSITLIILGLAALAIGVWYVITHWDKLKAAIMDTEAFKWVMSVAEQVGQVFADVWTRISEGWDATVAFFLGLSPVAAFEGFADTIGNVFGKLFDVLKNTFASTYNWIVEKLNKIHGVNIDLKTVETPATNAKVPAQVVAVPSPGISLPPQPVAVPSAAVNLPPQVSTLPQVNVPAVRAPSLMSAPLPTELPAPALVAATADRARPPKLAGGENLLRSEEHTSEL